MEKLRAISFLLKCVGYIGWRILRGRSWNILTANLEDVDGRRNLHYMRTAKKYVLSNHITKETK